MAELTCVTIDINWNVKPFPATHCCACLSWWYYSFSFMTWRTFQHSYSSFFLGSTTKPAEIKIRYSIACLTYLSISMRPIFTWLCSFLIFIALPKYWIRKICTFENYKGKLYYRHWVLGNGVCNTGYITIFFPKKEKVIVKIIFGHSTMWELYIYYYVWHATQILLCASVWNRVALKIRRNIHLMSPNKNNLSVSFVVAKQIFSN